MKKAVSSKNIRKTVLNAVGGIILLAFFSAVLLFLYFDWSRSGRAEPGAMTDYGSLEYTESGINTGRGNLVGIQAYMTPADYFSEERFYNKLDFYMAQAKKRGWFSDKSVVVFPEYIGAWLVVLGEKSEVYRAGSIESAMKTVVLSNLFRYLKAADYNLKADPQAAIFNMKAEKMASVYENVFSKLAGKYEVSIVGGSIILPNPSVEKGRIKVKKGELHNVSFLFNKDGTVEPPAAIKVHPTKDEKGFIRPGKAENLPVFELPFGRTGVLICADAWYPVCYKELEKKDVEVIIVASYITRDGKLEEKWKGYSGWPAPSDVEPSDVGTITEGDAWMRYALPGRMKETKAKTGFMVCLRGKLWDLGADGHTIIVDEESYQVLDGGERGMISCLWIPPPDGYKVLEKVK